MDHRVVADGHIVANLHDRFVEGGVQYAVILYIHPVPYPDGIQVAPQYGVEPYGTIVTHHHISDDGGIVGQEAVLSHFRCKSPYILYQCHRCISVFFTPLKYGLSTEYSTGQRSPSQLNIQPGY